MQGLTIEGSKQIYRAAIDANAADWEGVHWWSEVHAELVQVLSARSAAKAAKVIAWWHNDWTMVNDTAKSAAQRIRVAFCGIAGVGGV